MSLYWSLNDFGEISSCRQKPDFRKGKVSFLISFHFLELRTTGTARVRIPEIKRTYMGLLDFIE